MISCFKTTNHLQIEKEREKEKLTAIQSRSRASNRGCVYCPGSPHLNPEGVRGLKNDCDRNGVASFVMRRRGAVANHVACSDTLLNAPTVLCSVRYGYRQYDDCACTFSPSVESLYIIIIHRNYGTWHCISFHSLGITIRRCCTRAHLA
jgi:hypothetical protein